jgi:hypothetical protein
MAKKPRCAYCKKPFKPPHRGRPPRYCSASHRQQAYIRRRMNAYAERSHSIPMRLLANDIYAMQTKAGFERAVVEVLRKLALLPSAPKPPQRLSLVNNDDED